MILTKWEESINTEFGAFSVGQTVVGNSVSDEYEGLTGHITEIRTGDDRDTDNETEDIYVCFDDPEDPTLIKKVEAAFSVAYGEPKTIDDIVLDMVIMAPEMLSMPLSQKRIRLYQINTERDKYFSAFMKLDFVISKYGKVPEHLYDMVFDGDVGTEQLEEIYRIFNVAHPSNYTGRSLSVSDVIELYDETGSKFLFCDSFGYKPVIFDNSLCGCGSPSKNGGTQL